MKKLLALVFLLLLAPSQAGASNVQVYPCFTTTANLLTCLISDYSIVWPANQGASGTSLINDGSGNLVWGSANLTVGSPITGGIDNGVLFADGSGNLDQNADFVFTGSNLGLGTASPGATLDVGGGFRVNSSGNLVKINGVTTSWPSSQGSASTVLQNDGSGTLTWVSPSTAITALTGDVTATGPGSAAATVNSVGGQAAATVATATTTVDAATSSNTPSTLVERNGSGNFSAGTITANLSGNATNVTGVVAVANGGTNSSAALSNNRVIVSSGGSIEEASAITGNSAVASDSNGLPTASSTSATELGYVHGVTSAVQTQLGSKMPLAGGTFTGAVVLSGDATQALNPVSYQQFNTAVFGLANKDSAAVCSCASNITLSGEQTIDGITTSSSPVLVTYQTTTSQNGIYVSGSGAWTRRSDSNSWANIVGTIVPVDAGGTTYGGTVWLSTAAQSGTLGTTAITYTQMAGAGTYTADGSNIILTGNQFSLNSVGGSSPSSVNTATVAANAATSLDTVSTIMKRDSSGNTAISNLTVGTSAIYHGSSTGTTTLEGGTNATGTLILPTPASTDTLVDLADTQTLSNKNLIADSTQLVSVSDSTKALTFNTSSQNTNTKFTIETPTISANTQISFPTMGFLDYFVTEFASQGLSNKSFTQAVVNDYLAMTEIGTPATPSAGTLLLYSKSGDNLYTLNSAGVENQVGSGTGGINYLQAGSSTNSGWHASGSGITVAGTTTNLPRSTTTPTGILFTGVSGSTAFGYFDFTLDPADYNVKEQVQFAQNGLIGSYATNNFQVAVYSCTVAWSSGTCGGTSTRLPLSTDSSAISGLPAMEGTYRTTFDAPGSAAKYIQFQIGLNSSNTNAIVLSDIIVGPGQSVQGAAYQYLGNPGFTVSAAFGTITNPVWNAWRIGDRMHVEGRWGVGTLAASNAQVILPTGYTVNSASLPAYQQIVGTVINPYGGSSQGIDTSYGVIFYNGSDTANLYFGLNTASGSIVTAQGSGYFNSGQPVTIVFDVPIAQWAGSGTVNVVQNDCEYVYNTSTADSNDTTSFGYGPAGVAIGSYTSTRQKTVQYLTPRSATDDVKLQVQKGSGAYLDLAVSTYASGIMPLTYQNTTTYGMGFNDASSTATQAVVVFGQYGYNSGSTYASTGTAWSSFTGYNWRVKKCAGGQAVGFGIAQPGVSSGLISASGVPGNTTGNAIASGYVGQTLTQTFANTAATLSNQVFQVGSTYSLPAGVWLVTGWAFINQGTSTGNSYFLLDVNTSATLRSYGPFEGATSGTVNISGQTMPLIVNSSTATNIYLMAQYNYSTLGSSNVQNGYIQAVRID
jgi:hypothetical protein